MKKILVLVFAAVLALCLFAGCGSDSDSGSKDAAAPAGSAEVKGEVYDAGEVSAIVPDGWKAFPMFMNEEEMTDNFNIYKGAKEDIDMFTCPGMSILCDASEPYMDFYDDVVELEPITTGDYTWTAYTATSFDTPLAILYTESGDESFQVSVWLDNGEGTISLEDADVQAILASIKAS